MKLIIRDVEPERYHSAVNVAKAFLAAYPCRPHGVRNCVIYSKDYTCDNAETYAAYRTKTAVVVRGTNKGDTQ